MSGLPDYYDTLDVDPRASLHDLEQAYRKRTSELQDSKGPDAAEELQEVENAYSILRDPSSRANYDAKRRLEEARQESKYAELDKLLPRNRHHVRRFSKGSSGWLDALWAIFDFLR